MAPGGAPAAEGVARDAHGVRPRGLEVSRLEGFSDAVFGMALTLLVVSLDAPRTFDALLDDLKGFVAFAPCFALFLQIWHQHHVFFRRYGLRDAATVALNGALLLVVLAYVYPLRFLATLVTGELTGLVPRALQATGEPVIRQAQVPQLMYVYGAGFAAVSLLLALLYLHAWRRRSALGLDAPERHATLVSVAGNLVLMASGLGSVALTAAGARALWASSPYWLIGPAMFALSAAAARRRPPPDQPRAGAPA